jgi:hypothetical protein
MGFDFYIDSSLPSALVSDLTVMFERIADRCPSDALLSFYLLSVGGKLCMDVTLNSATMHFKESLESRSYAAIKRGLENIFKSRLEGWRQSRS